ncbi:MAG TPA: hypothetical protein VKH15_15300 [Candidatus Acidoferrum sp.]|nr:hypothetical protein [Candidatus Acidoferrum sp.]
MNKLTRAQKAAITKCAAEILETQEQDLARHQRLCEVCKHPACSLIQEAFLQWTSPEVIMKKYGLKSRATVYNHAHAFRLFARRDRTLRFALGHIIEQADRVNVTARDVIQAVYTYAHVNDDGMWVQPASQSEIVVSKHEPAASPPEPYSGSAAPMARSASKPTSRRRRPKYTPPAQDPAKSPQELDAEAEAAYLQVAAPDTFVPSRSVAEAAQRSVVLVHNVPRPNRNPSDPYGPVLISTNEAHGPNTK